MYHSTLTITGVSKLVSVSHFYCEPNMCGKLFSSSTQCVITHGWYALLVCVSVCVDVREGEFDVHNPNMNVIYLSIVRLHRLIFSAVFCYYLLYKNKLTFTFCVSGFCHLNVSQRFFNISLYAHWSLHQAHLFFRLLGNNLDNLICSGLSQASE